MPALSATSGAETKPLNVSIQDPKHESLGRGEIKTVSFSIKTLTDERFVPAVEAKLLEIAGVESAAVSLFNQSAHVYYDSTQTSPEAIRALLGEAGYDVVGSH
jgi:copper chaperone CopZ